MGLGLGGWGSGLGLGLGARPAGLAALWRRVLGAWCLGQLGMALKLD